MAWDSLRYLVESYFHQDYDLEAPTAAGVVAKFAASETSRLSEAVLEDVSRALIELGDEHSLADLWGRELGASYEPSKDHLSYRQWFEQMRDVLRGR